MNKDNRPTGRKTNVTSGGGNARRRGSGVNTGGPVGGGYSGRKTSSNSSGNSSNKDLGDILGSFTSSNTGSSSSSSSSAARGLLSWVFGGGIKRILIVAVVLIVGFFILKQCMGGGNFLSEFFGGDTSADTTDVSDNVQTDETSYSAYTPDLAVSDEARDKRTELLGGGKDVVTVMVYMCGTDLESEYGMATADLNEMIHAAIGDNVNIIVETGGAKKWNNSVISSSTNQRYQVTSNGLKVLESKLGKRSMVDASTLTDFIQYCASNYPANRNILIMWDHGGGSITGYGYDQYDGSDSMTLDEFNTALKNAGCTFDIIGFDACLMATLETALVANQYADYLIASEATEPGSGWYYTDWITELNSNTGISSVELGKQIIDDYIVHSDETSSGSSATLSVIDLAEMSGTVPSAFSSFSESTTKLIENDGYDTVSDARSGAKNFSVSTEINQIDFIHFLNRLNTTESKTLSTKLKSCVKYNRTSGNVANAYGVSIYFPYDSLNKVSSALSTYEKIGMDSSYTECIRSFASMTTGGQAVSSGSGNLLDVLLSGYGSSSSDSGSSLDIGDLLSLFLNNKSTKSIPSWLDKNLVSASQSFYEKNALDPDSLKITVKNGQMCWH